VAKYKESGRIKTLVEHVIRTNSAHHHLHVGQPNIACLLRTGEWLSKGELVYARIAKVSEQVTVLTGIEWILCVNEIVWDGMSQEQRLALLDHELCHIEWDTDATGMRKVDKRGRPVWARADYDFKGFAGVIQRHGLWSPNTRRFFESTKKAMQGELFGEEELAAVGSRVAKPVEETFDISFDENGRPIFTQRPVVETEEEASE